MRTLFILLLGVAVVLAIKSFKDGPKNFPSQFTATFNETDFVNWYYPSGVKTLYWDADNKRARETVVNQNKQPEDYYLLYQAPGSEPGSHAANGYTTFVTNPDYPQYVPNNCYYQSANGDASTPFNEAWWAVAPRADSSTYNFLFEYPDNMAYVGVDYIPELGVYADRWDSIKRCNLKRSPYGEIACTSVFQSRDSNQYTLKEINAYAARTSFDSDVYLVRVYLDYEPSVSDDDFSLPKNWPVSCGYADSGFNFEQYTTIYAGATNANFSLSLKAPPVEGLGGTVKVTLILTPNSYYNCSDCVTMSDHTMSFDSTNWNVPQYLWLDYIATGCEQFAVKATGGGYDWQYEALYSWAIFESCHHDPVWGFCKETRICGDP
jgi:hypothetical protein